jgi:hypothetical protein
VKIRSSMKVEEEVDLKTMLESLPFGENINFMLEF